MHRTVRGLAALLTLLALAVPVVPSAAAHASSGLLAGVNLPGLRGGASPAEADREIAQARALHARIVRVDFPWAALEPTGPTLDPRALAFTDRLVADAQSAGIKLVATVAQTPCWASSAPAALLRRCTNGRRSAAEAWPPSDDSAYAAVLSLLAQRYGSRLAAIEIWNEPDQSNEDYFAGPNKVENYARLLRAAYPAVKQAAPSVQVVAGSFVGSNGLFLKDLYAAGIKGYYDGLSVHFYHLTLGSLRAIREVQTANHDTKPLWLDEFGWTSCWPGRSIEQEQPCVTSATQALNLRNAVREMARAPYLDAAIVYKLQDSPGETFGALNLRGRHKPSFHALREAFERPAGPFSRVTMKLRSNGSRVTVSGTGPVADYMGLEVFQGSTLRYRALFTLDRFNRYSIPLPAALGTRGLRVRVFQYWAGMSRAASARI